MWLLMAYMRETVRVRRPNGSLNPNMNQLRGITLRASSTVLGCVTPRVLE